MGAVGALARRSLARGRGGWLVVVCLTVTSTGGSLTALAASRRTGGTYDRVLERQLAADARIGMGVPGSPAGSLAVEDVEALPGVREVAVARGVIAAGVDGRDLLDPDAPLGVTAAVDADIWRTIDRPILLDGRLPADDDAGGVALTADLAARLGLQVGDRLRFGVLTFDEAERASTGELDVGARVEPQVTGIVRPWDPGEGSDPFHGEEVLASRAFLDAHPGAGTYQMASLRLVDGAAGLPALTRAIEQRFADVVDLSTRADREDDVARLVAPEAAALAVLAAVLAVVGLGAVAQAAARTLAVDRDDVGILDALGVDRRQRALAGFAAAGAAVVVGTAIGAAAAVAASPVAPVGLVRALEPGAGVLVDPAVHLVGAACWLLTLGGIGGVLAWTMSAPRARRLDAVAGGRLRRVLRDAPPAWRIGASLASRADGARRQVRSITAGTGVCVVGLVVVVTFGSSLRHLVTTPRLFGHDYDLSAWDGYGAVPDQAIAAALAQDPDVASVVGVADATGSVDGHETSLLGFDGGWFGPAVTSGRGPAVVDDVLLGRHLAEELGVDVGDVVRVRAGAAAADVRVTGIGVLPVDDAVGAAFTLEGLHALAPEAEVGSQYVRLAPGADVDAVRRRLVAALGCDGDCDVEPPVAPTSIARLDRVGALPTAVAAVVAVGGLVGAAHGARALARRNCRSAAILRATGATTREAARCLLAQVTLALAGGLLLGVPIGVAVARVVWRTTADAAGAVPVVTVPWMELLVTVAVLVAVAELVAAVPGRAVARRPVAGELRAL